MKLAEEGIVGKRGSIAYYDELHSGACHGYVHAAKVAKETYLALVVAAHKGDDDHITLLALETIDSVDGDLSAKWFEERGVGQQPAQELYLGAVGRYHAHVDALVEETLFADALDVALEGLHRQDSLILVQASVALPRERLFECQVAVDFRRVGRGVELYL